MMRALYAGVAGLRTHQTRMDVIGNNIANVNTTSYKSQSMTFSDLMYQTTQAASGANPTTGVGGVNARQIGLGSKTSAIKTAITSQGAAQTTNDPFDIMISGDAFFVVSNGSENFFTRDGSFYIDGMGNLAMTSTGYNVMGWGVDPENPNAIKPETVTALRIMKNEYLTYKPEATTEAVVSGNVDKNDTDVNSSTGKMMNLEFYDNQGYKYTAKLSVHAISGETGDFYVMLDDVLEEDGTSVMWADEDKTQLTTMGESFTLGTETAWNTSTADIKDANGDDVDEDVNGNTLADLGATKRVAMLKYVNGDGAFDFVGQDSAVDDAANKITLGFGGAANAPNFQDIDIDFSTTANYNMNGSSTIGALRGDKDGVGAGRKEGEMSGITVQKDGMIYASYDNGQERLLGQIAVATFANASGLAKEGDNLYSATQNSGEFDGIGDDITVGGGYMNSGVLEMSNVDLSAEFTEMITTQRGFQANSRISTVSDTLLEELTNLKR